MDGWSTNPFPFGAKCQFSGANCCFFFRKCNGRRNVLAAEFLFPAAPAAPKLPSPSSFWGKSMDVLVKLGRNLTPVPHLNFAGGLGKKSDPWGFLGKSGWHIIPGIGQDVWLKFSMVFFHDLAGFILQSINKAISRSTRRSASLLAGRCLFP